MMWLNSIISALPGALISGAVISSIFNWQLNQRRLQLQTTFELHHEWNGESLRLGLSGMEFRGCL
jgi:hypothetical protein